MDLQCGIGPPQVAVAHWHWHWPMQVAARLADILGKRVCICPLAPGPPEVTAPAFLLALTPSTLAHELQAQLGTALGAALQAACLSVAQAAQGGEGLHSLQEVVGALVEEPEVAALANMLRQWQGWEHGNEWMEAAVLRVGGSQPDPGRIIVIDCCYSHR